MTKKNTILHILNHKYEYPLSIYHKNKTLEIIEKCNYYEIEGFSNTLVYYIFLIGDKTKFNLGILLNNEIVSWNIDENIFYCSCLKNHCDHIYFVIYFFSGITGIHSYLYLGCIDFISMEIFRERLCLCFNFAE